MSKRALRIFSLVILLAIVLTSPVFVQPCFARNSDYIDSYGAYLYSPDSNSVQVWFELKANVTSDVVGVQTIFLQVSDNAKDWTTIQTFKHASYPHLMAYDTISLSTYVEATIESGHYYRAGLTFYVEDNGGSDSRFYTTNSIWI